MFNKMRHSTPACVLLLALVAMGLLRGITALKPRMTPAGEELLVQEGDDLIIECKAEVGHKLQFSTQKNVVNVKQSEFHISFDNDSGWYTFTRPKARKKDTGWYACAEEGIEIKNDEQTVDHPDADISWIYVYVNSSKSFVFSEGEDTRAHIYALKGRSVVIPCRTTLPNLPATLGIPVDDDGTSLYTVDITRQVNIYDPKIGFIVNETDSLASLLKRLNYYEVRCGINGSVAQSAEYSIHIYTPTLMIEQGRTVAVIVDEALTLDCVFDVFAGCEDLFAYWDIPGSVSLEEVRFNRTPIYRSEILEIRNLRLTIKDLTQKHLGDYSCVIKDPSTGFTWNKKVTVQKRGRMTRGESKRANLTEEAALECYVTGFSRTNYKWSKIEDSENNEYLGQTFVYNDDECSRMSLRFENVSRENNGTYECRAEVDGGIIISDRTDLIVIEVPEVKIKFTTSGGADTAYLNWTVFDRNDPVTMYSIQRRKNGTTVWIDCSRDIGGGRTNYVATGLEKDTAYLFKITARNSIGVSHPDFSKWITTLDEDPELFVPKIWTEVTSDTLVTIGWSTPPLKFEDQVHYYKVRASHGTTSEQSTHVAAEYNYHTFDKFESGTKYSIEVAACSKYTGKCGDWSNKKKIIVIHKDPQFIPNVSIKVSTINSMKIEWLMPRTELLERVHYYKVLARNLTKEIGPFYVNRTENSYVCEDLEPSTSYLLKVAACSENRTLCWDWSLEKEGSTLADGEVQVLPWFVGSIVAIPIILIMAIWMGIRSRREMAARRRFMLATIEVFKSGARDTLDPELAMAEQAELLPYDKGREFPRKLLKIGKVLGSGAFGIVKIGEAKSICKGQKFSTVAVKMVRAAHRLEHMTALIRELKVLSHLGKHLNIVNLLGACTNRISYGELLVIVEYCRFGNLHDYLLRRRADFIDQVNVATGNVAGTSFRMTSFIVIDTGMMPADSHDNSATGESSKSTTSDNTIVAIGDDSFEPVQVFNYEGDFTDSDLKPIGTLDLLCWAWQVSRGMNYLSPKMVVYGDLAARNILFADNNVVKICDFGLAKSLYAGDIYKKSGNGPLPVKWMSVEAIGDRVFSVKSDVWSYGIVLWEFFALAATPYPGITNEDVYQKLVDGFRMERPKYATEVIYRVMLNCWDAEPSKRPSFGEIEDIIDGLLDGKSKEHYTDFDVAYAVINAKELADGKDVFTMTPAEYLANTAETAV